MYDVAGHFAILADLHVVRCMCMEARYMYRRAPQAKESPWLQDVMMVGANDIRFAHAIRSSSLGVFALEKTALAPLVSMALQPDQDVRSAGGHMAVHVDLHFLEVCVAWRPLQVALHSLIADS